MPDFTQRQWNDIGALYHATGQLPPGVSPQDLIQHHAVSLRGINLNPPGGLDPAVQTAISTGFGQSKAETAGQFGLDIIPVALTLGTLGAGAALAPAGEAAAGAMAAGEAQIASGAGAAIGGAAGGPQGSQIGGVAGGIAGGAVTGGFSGAGDEFNSTAADPGIAGFGAMGSQMPQIGGAVISGAAGGAAGAGDLFNSTAPDPGISGFGSMGSQMPQIGTPTGVSGVLGGASPGVNPKGAVGGASGGGPGPGSSIGVDPTGGSVAGGASGGATAPGSTALGTGAASDTTSGIAKNIFKDFQDLSTAARFAQSLDAITSGTQAQGGQATAPAATQTQPAVPQSPLSAIPSASAQPISEIAASGTTPAALPTGEFQAITQDFAKQTENAIRAQFANQGISGSPMEQRQIQSVGAQATQRASAAEQAMGAAGVSDPNVFAALMVSNISPAEFASSLQRLRAQRAI